jgi:hypothetical protein
LVEETHKNLMEYGSELNAFLNRASFWFLAGIFFCIIMAEWGF